MNNSDDPVVQTINSQYRSTLAVAILMTILAVIFAIVIIMGFSSIELAVEVIDAAADFTADTKRVVFVPIVSFFIGLIVFCLGLGAIICVFSMN